MWKLIENKEYSSLRDRFSWVKDMEGVPQDVRYHAEGDVAIHTKMVVEDLCKMSDYQLLDEQSKEILWAAALMHDIEKRSTTVIEQDGSISSAGHAKKGAMTTRQILFREHNTPFQIREEIVGLVRHHGLPIWIFEKENPQKALLKASFEVNTHWVYMLAKADILGRICTDQKELLYRIELFKELCIENDCWGKAKAFPSDLAKFLYFRKEEQMPDYEPFDATWGEVIMLSGIAGAGKDTFCQKRFGQYPVVSLDNIRRELKISPTDSSGNGKVIQAAKELAKTYLRKKTPFVWNATNITRQMRETLIDLFVSYKANVRIMYLEVPYRKLHQQNLNREFAIPSKIIEKMIDKLEIPKAWEATFVEWIV